MRRYHRLRQLVMFVVRPMGGIAVPVQLAGAGRIGFGVPARLTALGYQAVLVGLVWWWHKRIVREEGILLARMAESMVDVGGTTWRRPSDPVAPPERRGSLAIVSLLLGLVPMLAWIVGRPVADVRLLLMLVLGPCGAVALLKLVEPEVRTWLVLDRAVARSGQQAHAIVYGHIVRVDAFRTRRRLWRVMNRGRPLPLARQTPRVHGRRRARSTMEGGDR